MLNNPLVSIIVPTYKRSNLIEEAIKSILCQTYKNIEIIVVDDNGVGSYEQRKTEDRIENFNNILYFPLEKNFGATYARNFGAEKARGQYLAFFDDDDFWVPKKIEIMINTLESYDKEYAFAYSPQQAIDYYTKKTLYFTNCDFGTGNIIESLRDISKGIIGVPNPIVRKSAFWEIGGFDINQKSAQDVDFILRLANKFKGVRVNEVLLIVNIHKETRITSNHQNKIEGYRLILEKYKNFLNRDSLKMIYQRLIYHSFFLGNSEYLEHYHNILIENDYSIDLKYKILTVKSKVFRRTLKYFYQTLKK